MQRASDAAAAVPGAHEEDGEGGEQVLAFAVGVGQVGCCEGDYAVRVGVRRGRMGGAGDVVLCVAWAVQEGGEGAGREGEARRKGLGPEGVDFGNFGRGRVGEGVDCPVGRGVGCER